jgi:hypothetical protein
MRQSPLTIVKDKFGDKQKLVEAVEKFTNDDLWVARTNKDKGLAHVSNAKLLRLHEIFTSVKDRFGTRAKLIDAILDVEKRSKDDGYRARLSKFPVPRLWDMFRTGEKRSKAASKPAAKAAPKAEAAPKPAAKKTAAKKAAKAPAAAKTAKKAASKTAKKAPSKKK